MITADQIPAFLLSIGFTKRGGSWNKTWGVTVLSVDTAKKEIHYPEAITVHEKQTCNFSANENFVVLECVNRLLDKGYKPEHLELEPKWKLGHGSSGGRADILVKDHAGKALLIIECKTAGSEFKRAWGKTLQDGDQLFSYAQQSSETQFLCLYTCDFEANAVTYQSHLIAHRDNPQYLDDNPDFKPFAAATDVRARFSVWRDTYKLDYRSQGLFEAGIPAYQIGKDKYTLADLHSVSDSDRQKKYHEFATILRQHNVSGRENAFDKLVNLFLCKLADETINPRELKFYWKGVAYDTHFDLLDRLQQLYQAGMEKFLGETITYIDRTKVNEAMRFIRQNPDATQKAVWHLFQQQKFFTNNDFSLIDVHNEKLFYQNADVLLKILQLWQDIRLTSDGSSSNQFLGDMFEGFLDQGVKQSEGQYFTPMPICRFILMSLPLSSLVSNSTTPLKAIDYACGSGHFLNELAVQLNPLVARHRPDDVANQLKAQHQAIYGIEKEYRLSKVSKVSAFMYGQQNINICHGDALAQTHPSFSGIANDSFDLLVANPPYSVRGFLETLPDADRAAYDLTATVDKLDSNNSIEAFFIERAKQLLKAGGVAAIILPSSILSNGSSIYVKTREILLQYFDFVAIVELGSGTFGKTGTNTVTLFLRRKQTTPDTAEHYRERVAQWFNTDHGQPSYQDIYQDEHLLASYTSHIGVGLTDYKTLLTGQINGAWRQADHFETYAQPFNDSTEVKNLYKQKSFKLLSDDQQAQDVDRRYLRHVRAVEQDKLYYFVLASTQTDPVLIIKGLTDMKAQQAFLGYGWRGAKGDEGIKLVKDAQGRHVTALYDETNRDNPVKLNRLIADNFQRQLGVIPEVLAEFATPARMVDALDFSRAGFDKQIRLGGMPSRFGEAKHLVSTFGGPKTPLNTALKRSSSLMDPKTQQGLVCYVGLENIESHTGLLVGQTVVSYTEVKSIKSVFLAGDILYGKLRPNLNKVHLAEQSGICSTDILVLRAANSQHAKFYAEYLRTQLFNVEVLLGVSGQQLPRTSWEYMKAINVPAPTAQVISEIVFELNNVNVESATCRSVVALSQAEITKQVAACFKQYPLKSLQQICNIKRGRFSHRPRNDPQFFNGPYPFIQTGDVVHAVASKVAYSQTLNEEGLAVSKLFQPPVVLVTIAANIGDTAVLDYPACFTDSVVGLLPVDGVDARFLELMMRARKQHLNDIAPQMAQKNINIEILKPITVPMPSQAVQKKFVTTIEKLEKTIAQARATIADAPVKKLAVMQRYL